MRTSVAIRAVAAAPGARARGWLDIGETAGGPLRVPLVIIN